MPFTDYQPGQGNLPRFIMTKPKHIDGEIVGVVDKSGACHSVVTGDKQFANTHFPEERTCVWRWATGKGVYVVTPDVPETEIQTIRNHLEARYGIR